MTDTTNPRAQLDEALAAMRRAHDFPAPAENITMEATVACAEALSLLVDAHLAAAPESEPETDPRESLPDQTPVGHGWVIVRDERELFKPHNSGRFTRWLAPRWEDEVGEWGESGASREPRVYDSHVATVGDLRRLGVPVTEWPDIEPEPGPVPLESLSDDTAVGHGWVMDEVDLFKPQGRRRFARWPDGAQEWGPSVWYESAIVEPRPATVGDLRRVGLPESEWPDITAPEPVESEEPPDGSVVLVNGIAWQRRGGLWHPSVEWTPARWSHLLAQGTPTVIHAPKEAP